MDNAKQQIVDSITSASNILVTVSSNPSVDELSAALGLTLILDKLDRRATAIFSGTIPPAITFLEPEKTFEDSADSLRDFIIALNKDKADHLRYKVDGDVVKIFITPYKTTLGQTDLEFSQGDYNVELVLALGVKDQDHLDSALSAHGKILHDAKVVTVTAGEGNQSKLGSTDWHDDKASSLSEMIVSLVNVLKGDKELFDQQTSTALLTGIVSATDRFSNDRTSSQVMTLAAQLMAAGANQQLIAAKLQEGNDIAPAPAANAGTSDSEISKDGTELVIDREEKPAVSNESTPEPQVSQVSPAPEPPKISNEDADQLELEKQLAGLTTPTGTMADIEKQLQEEAPTAPAETNEVSPPLAATPEVPPLSPLSDATMPDFEPAIPPVPTPVPEPQADQLAENSDTSQPPIIAQEAEGHSAPVGILPPDQAPAINGTLAPETQEETVDPFKSDGIIERQETTFAPPVEANIGTAEGAALLAGTADISPAPPALDQSPAMPQIPELPPLPPLPTDGSIAPLPPPPPPPVFGGQTVGPTTAGAVSGDVFGDAVTPAPAEPVASTSAPGQFKIPGQ